MCAALVFMEGAVMGLFTSFAVVSPSTLNNDWTISFQDGVSRHQNNSHSQVVLREEHENPIQRIGNILRTQ